jgi:hypothetical protein
MAKARSTVTATFPFASIEVLGICGITADAQQGSLGRRRRFALLRPSQLTGIMAAIESR